MRQVEFKNQLVEDGSGEGVSYHKDQNHAKQALSSLKGLSKRGNRIHDPVNIRDKVGKVPETRLYEPNRIGFTISDLIYCLLPWKRKSRPKQWVPAYRFDADPIKYTRPNIRSNRQLVGAGNGYKAFDTGDIEIDFDDESKHHDSSKRSRKKKRPSPTD